MTPDLSARVDLPERMDDPDCPDDLLLRTVRQFASINRLTARYRTILTRWVLNDMQKDPARAYHLVDMGAGGCDIDRWLLSRARALGLRLRITACDLDPRIIAQARTVCGDRPDLQIRHMNLLHEKPKEPVDYLFANHFLHHLSDAQIIGLLRFWHPHVERRMVFSDLERNRGAYRAYSLLSLFYRNSFAREDGLLSIRRGFRTAELKTFAGSALPQVPCRIDRLPPGRLVLSINGRS